MENNSIIDCIVFTLNRADIWAYLFSMSLPLFIENMTGSCILPSLYVYTSIHRKWDRQLRLTLPLYIYLYSQKIGQVVGAYSPYISIPLFIENRTGSWGSPSLSIYTSMHRKQDRQSGLTLSLCIYLYSQKIGQVVGAHPFSMSISLFIENRTGSWGSPFFYVYTSIHRKQDRQLGLTLPLYLYLFSQKIEQVVGAFPFSMSLPLFIENRTGIRGSPFLYVYTSLVSTLHTLTMFS